MAHTDSSVDVTQKIHDILDSARVNLELKGVYYGDQALIPEYPAVAVETLEKSRSIAGTRRYELILRTGILLYYGKVQSSVKNREEQEKMAEKVEAELLRNRTLDGLVVFGYVTSVQFGIIVRESAMISSARIVWEGLSRKTF